MFVRRDFAKGLLSFVLGCLISALPIVWPTSAALAKTRYAFVIGVGNYKEESGIRKLLAPANDAELMRGALESKGIDFVVSMVRDSEVADKTSFKASFDKFLAQIQPKDEVLFYFSGHGFNHPDKGNFFLLPDAKGQGAYIQSLSPADARLLDNDDKRAQKYRDWLADVAISEAEVEKSISATKADVIIIVADACRSLLSKAKGLVPVTSNLTVPRDLAAGVYHLYSASPGQESLDSPDRGPSSRDVAAHSGEKRDAEEKREASLFTRTLLQELQVPNLEINLLFSKVKIAVRREAREIGGIPQIPDFNDSKEATDFYFRAGYVGGDLALRCGTARNELTQLRYGVASGSIGRGTLEDKRGELAPCGAEYVAEIDKLLRLEGQGAGALSATSPAKPADFVDVGDPVQLCNVYGSSPFDPDRPQDVGGYEVQRDAVAALEKPADRARTMERVGKLVAGCEEAIKSFPRVARYKFNLARAHYALATLAEDKLVRESSLIQASKHAQEAADLGYAAAYNDLGLLYKNGEFYDPSVNPLKRGPPDRAKAYAYLKRGADLNHVLAQYNLGMAFRNGDLTEVDISGQTSGESAVATEKTREAEAFQLLSRAAEAGYVPAMIETAIMLHDWPGIERDPKRAASLLEVAASRGSFEAMYYLGRIYDVGALTDPGEAVVWYARAAEAGDTRSQTRLAVLLLDGKGLPAAQPDAAGRYLRLASAAGETGAQMLLADKLQAGKIAFRPRTDGKVDGGAHEILSLYASAFTRGNSMAGLQLAKLYRTGFPVEHPSDAIPKSPADAVSRLWDTIDKVRSANPASNDADPRIEALAATELIRMFDAGEAKSTGGPDLISADQIDQLRRDYGDVDQHKYIRVSAVGPVNCHNWDLWALIWDAKHGPMPTEAQFDWFERAYNCRVLTSEEKDADKEAKKSGARQRKPSELGIPKKTREIFKREFDASLKDMDNKDKEKKRSFVDRMVAIVSNDKSR